jgi:hypothetical protein
MRIGVNSKAYETATVWLCQDCTLVHANGECDPYRPADLPEPLSAIDDGDELTLGLLEEEHDDECTETDRAEGGCNCEQRSFSWSRCDGCGSDLGGDRHAATLWWTPKEGD